MRDTSTKALPPILPRFIAIIGQEASGKDSYGNYLATKGYLHVSAGDVLRARARADGHSDPIPRSILSQVGDALKQEFGPSPIVASTFAQYAQARERFPGGLVISGLRRVGELYAFKERGAVLIWIDADDDRRFANQNQRARGDRQDRAAFLERSKKEYYGDTAGGTDGVNLQAVEALADCTVTNNGSLQDLFVRADAALRKYCRPEDLLYAFHRAMLHLSAEEFAALFSKNARYEFPFITPGRPAFYMGREEIHAGFQKVWENVQVRVDSVDDIVVYKTTDPAVIVAEQNIHATATTANTHFVRPSLLILHAKDGFITHLRDYADALSGAKEMGRLEFIVEAVKSMPSTGTTDNI